jgi:hypothetical protein
MPPPGDTAMRGGAIEAMPPSFLCVTRKLQERPYEALSARKVSQAMTQQMHLRPPPHAAKQAVVDFYTAINGHCGVYVPQPESMDLVTYQSYQQKQLVPPTMTVPAPVLGDSSPFNAAGSLAAMEDFRLQQIRQNEQQSKRGCHYFTTKEGCRRGALCPYQH